MVDDRIRESLLYQRLGNKVQYHTCEMVCSEEVFDLIKLLASEAKVR